MRHVWLAEEEAPGGDRAGLGTSSVRCSASAVVSAFHPRELSGHLALPTKLALTATYRCSLKDTVGGNSISLPCRLHGLWLGEWYYEVLELRNGGIR